MVDPVTHGFVGCIFKCHVTTSCCHNLCAEYAHTLYIGTLALHIKLPHVYNTFHPHERTYRSRSHTLLTATRFSNNLLFANSLRQQNLADGIVYLMRTCMTKILTLQIDG